MGSNSNANALVKIWDLRFSWLLGMDSPMTTFFCLYYELWADFTHCSGVSIVDFEQVNPDVGAEKCMAKVKNKTRLIYWMCL